MTPLPFALNPALQALSRLNLFRVRAVIDWIDIEIATASPTNFMTVQDRLGAILGRERKHWVEPIDEGAGRAASRFVLRIHDVSNYRSLIEIVDRLAQGIQLIGVAAVRQIEVAIDFYSKRSDRAELEAVTLRLKHHLSVRGDTELEAGLLTDPVDQIHALRLDRTLVIRDNGVQFKAYLKVTDNNQKPIPDADDHRARVEITLPSHRLLDGRDDLEALRDLRFESLAPWFPFRRLRPDGALASMNEKPMTAAGIARKARMDLALRRGSRELQVQSKRERRKHPPQTQSDTELKQRARGALRELTRRFARKAGKTSLTPVERTGKTASALITTDK